MVGQSHFQAGCLPRGASGYISWMIIVAQWDAGFTVPSHYSLYSHFRAVVLINVSISTPQNLLGRVNASSKMGYSLRSGDEWDAVTNLAHSTGRKGKCPRYTGWPHLLLGFPSGSDGKASACVQETGVLSLGRKIPF